MIVIGLTGNSGSGKSCVCQNFLKYNINSIDTDKTAREVCNKGKPCLNELVNFFGNTILNPDGTLNRKALAAIAFSDKQKHYALNSITHKYILSEVRLWLDTQKHEKRIAAIVDAPLLFESGFAKECDVIIAVTAKKDIRINRILERDDITVDAAELRLSKQGDDTFYTHKANYVIENNGSLEDLYTQTDKIYKKLFSANNRTE